MSNRFKVKKILILFLISYRNLQSVIVENPHYGFVKNNSKMYIFTDLTLSEIDAKIEHKINRIISKIVGCKIENF